MILTGQEIIKQVKLGELTIQPFVLENVNPNSYNYRLSNYLLEILDNPIDSKKPVQYKKIIIPEEGYVLQPKKIYLGSTVEIIGSKTYVTSLIGRSSVGRLGLFLQVTADIGQLGAEHNWTLELVVVQPLRIYPMMKIGQVSFWSVNGSTHQYKGKYAKYKEPHTSKIYEEFSNL